VVELVERLQKELAEARAEIIELRTLKVFKAEFDGG